MALRPSEIHKIKYPRIGDSLLADTQTAKVGTTRVPLQWFWKLGIQRKHINHRNKYITFVRCTFTYTCEVCNKLLRISMQLNDLLHTPQEHGNYLRLSPAYALMHSDTYSHGLQIFALKIFTVKHNYMCTLLFTCTYNCFIQRVICTDGPYTCTMYLQITDSFHGMNDVHKEQDRCTTFGWNPMGETSRLL
jgi:hypothetical protein